MKKIFLFSLIITFLYTCPAQAMKKKSFIEKVSSLSFKEKALAIKTLSHAATQWVWPIKSNLYNDNIRVITYFGKKNKIHNIVLKGYETFYTKLDGKKPTVIEMPSFVNEYW